MCYILVGYLVGGPKQPPPPPPLLWLVEGKSQTGEKPAGQKKPAPLLAQGLNWIRQSIWVYFVLLQKTEYVWSRLKGKESHRQRFYVICLYSTEPLMFPQGCKYVRTLPLLHRSPLYPSRQSHLKPLSVNPDWHKAYFPGQGLQWQEFWIHKKNTF